MAVRNKVLVATTLPSGGSPPYYTVPAGFETIVKSIIVWTPSVASGAYIDFYANDGAGNYVIFDSVTLSQRAWNRADFWFCLNSGHYLACDVGASPVHVWVSGAELPSV